MASGRLIDYLGRGLLADRPATPDLAPGGLGFYLAEDNSTLYGWDGTAWIAVTSVGAVAASAVTYDNTTSGLTATDVQAALDELAAGGGGGDVETVVAGSGIIVNDTDPANPVVSFDPSVLPAFLESVVAGANITIDNTDPQNPIIASTGGGGGGVTSPTISRIITSTDPNEPTVDGDLLIVIPSPKVVDVAYSPQTYGGADSVTSITLQIPSTTLSGDLILVFTGSSTSPITPSGYTRVAERDCPRTLSPTGLGYSAVFSKVAVGGDASANLTVNQTATGRFAGVIVIVRSSTGVGSVTVHTTNTLNGASNVASATHDFPSVVASVPGELALTTFSCALTNTTGNVTITYPAGWVPVTPVLTPTTPAWERLRHWVLSKKMRQGDNTALSTGCTHASSQHDWSSVAVLLRVV